jgi:hypothetical protein
LSGNGLFHETDILSEVMLKYFSFKIYKNPIINGLIKVYTWIIR